MKPTSNLIVFFFVLVFTGLFVHLPCHAQDSNMRYWEAQKQAARRQLAQIQPDINFVFHSRVVCDSTLHSIRDCHIINKTQHTGTVSNAYGDFRITANVNDSVSFSALGYEKLTIAVTDTMYNYGYLIKLKPKAYELPEVTIKPFQLDFPPISRFEIHTKPLPNQGGINIPTGISPISFFYNKYSKEGKQKRYYGKVMDGTADFMLIAEKFNGEMVQQITGLKDDELVRFMSFCNFSNEFLFNYSPETIQRAIRKKHEEFIR
jgi:hypothetical protein